jgi:hypothetical protein
LAERLDHLGWWLAPTGSGFIEESVEDPVEDRS